MAAAACGMQTTQGISNLAAISALSTKGGVVEPGMSFGHRFDHGGKAVAHPPRKHRVMAQTVPATATAGCIIRKLYPGSVTIPLRIVSMSCCTVLQGKWRQGTLMRCHNDLVHRRSRFVPPNVHTSIPDIVYTVPRNAQRPQLDPRPAKMRPSPAMRYHWSPDCQAEVVQPHGCRRQMVNTEITLLLAIHSMRSPSGKHIFYSVFILYN